MTMICAEIAQAHDGSYGNAIAFVEAAASVGADAVKFQCHDGDPNVTWGNRSHWCYTLDDCCRQAYLRRTAFTLTQWNNLRLHATKCQVQFGISCFSADAEKILGYVEPDFWKVPCGRWEYWAHMRFVKRIVVSMDFRPLLTGDDTELRTSLKEREAKEYREQALQQKRNAEPFNLQYVHCTPQYPCAHLDVGVETLLYPQVSGLSSHCPDIGPSLEAARLGAKYIEHHVCWDRRQFGPDTSSSITIDELALLVKGVREIEKERECVSQPAQ